MVTKNTYRILIWVIVILVATNLSMGLSFWYHKQHDKKVAEQLAQQVEMPSEQRTRFFREQLKLRADQMEKFRTLNRNYNRGARQITYQLEGLRVDMVDEMGKTSPDENSLDTISEEIGKLHTDLKKLTIDYYLSLKEACDEQQQQKLNEIFSSMVESKEDVSLPQRGRQNRGRHLE